MEGQIWRQGGWEEAFPRRRPPSRFPFPTRFVLISGHFSILQSLLDSAPIRSLWAASRPPRRWKKDAHHSFLIQAIDERVRQRKYTPVHLPWPPGSTLADPYVSSAPATSACLGVEPRWPQAWVVASPALTLLGMHSMGPVGTCGQAQTAPPVCPL